MNSNPQLFCIQNSSVFERYGGIETYLDDLLGLARRTFGTATALFPVPRATSLSEKPYRVLTVPRSNSKWIRRWHNRFSWPLFQAARRYCRKHHPDFLIAGHVSLGPLVYALHRDTGIPFLTCAYGIECWGDLYPQDEWCLRRALGIIAISHWTKARLVDRGIPASTIQIVQPMLPVPFQKRTVPTFEETSGGPPLRLLTVSRLDADERYKGHDHVLEALQKIRLATPGLAIRYQIHGGGSDRQRLEEKVRNLGLGDQVFFSDPSLDRNILNQVYAAADVFVMPSRFGRWDGRWRGEGFGIAYLEAAAFGLPSVAYDCGGATDIIEDGVNGRLVTPDDVDGLADAIAQMARDRNLVEEMGRRAYAQTMERFTEAPIRRQLEQAVATFQTLVTS